MNRIILVGNGFDLAHNLPTKYEDFINWYSQERLKGFKNNETCEDDDILCKLRMKNTDTIEQEVKKKVISKEKYENYFGSYNCDSLHEFFTMPSNRKFKGILDILSELTGKFNVEYSHLFENITKSIETKGWVDIENEYYNLLRSFLTGSQYDKPELLNNELNFIRVKLIEYLTKVQDKSINEGILNQ